MKRAIGILFVIVILVTSWSGLNLSTADEDAESAVIGTFYRVAVPGDLTEDHASWSGPKLEVNAPAFATRMEIDQAYLDQVVGDWASSTPFTPTGEAVAIEDEQAEFFNFTLGQTPVFTWGSNDQIRFQDRPMWISARQQGYGGAINLTMEDGESTGQQIFISKPWLWDRGIHRPNVTHEDGSFLEVTPTPDGEGFLFDMPHFSDVVINPAELDVKGRQAGLVFPHPGERRWDAENMSLEIDVGTQAAEYEVLTEKDWVDLHLPSSYLLDYTPYEDEEDNTEYYVATVPAKNTPLTLSFVSLPHDPEPADRELYVSPTGTTLNWSASDYLDSNWSVFMEDSHRKLNLSKDVSECTEIDQTHCDHIHLKPGSTYYWQVVMNISGLSVPGPVWTFRTEPDYWPGVPMIESPLEGATISGSSVNLSWNPTNHTHAEDVNYSVLLEPWNANPGKVYSPCHDIGGTMCSVHNLTSGVRYSWRILAYDQFKAVNSTVGSFYVSGDSGTYDGIVYMDSITPYNGSLHNPLSLSLSWESIDPNMQYDVYVDEALAFQDENESLEYFVNGTLPPLRTKICQEVTTTCNVVLESWERVYQWGIVPTGENPVNITQLTFRTDLNLTFGGAEILAPLNEAINVSSYSYLYWDGPVNDETFYRVYIKEPDGDWELECVVRVTTCAPRDLELGVTYQWRVDEQRRAVVISGNPFNFSVQGYTSITMPKTMLFLHGHTSETYQYWSDVRKLLLQGDDPPNSEPAYDRVIAVGYYGGECYVPSNGRAENFGHPLFANSHADMKPWRHDGGMGCDGSPRQHWKDSHIEHLSYHLSWYIYDQYTAQDAVVDVAAHSMGGLLVRYAMSIVEKSSSAFDFDFDSQEYPRYCENNWPWTSSCRETSGSRGNWPGQLAVKDIVTWGTPHTGLRSGINCGVFAKLAFCQQVDSTAYYGSPRFLDWMENYAQNPQTTSGMLPHGSFWSLVGSKWDVIVSPSSATHGMNGYWAKFYYESPNYVHSRGPLYDTYYEDASPKLNGEGSVWFSDEQGEERNDLLDQLQLGGAYPRESSELPRTGYWLYLTGHRTWSEVENYEL